jgi:hypothetical protein
VLSKAKKFAQFDKGMEKLKIAQFNKGMVKLWGV